MPTELFFIINFSISLTASIIGLIVGILIIVIVVTHRQCRTVSNLLACNACMISIIYCSNNIIVSIYGYREDWALQQPVCIFRAYCFLVSCVCICYSYLMQAISRLFFTVFFKYKFLVTFRAHWLLIILNWIIGTVFSIGPLFFDGGFTFEEESRLCTLNSRKPSASLYSIGGGFVLPVSICITIYGIIWRHTVRSSRRINAFGPNNATAHTPNAKREMTIVRNMLMSLTVFVGGGTPLLILILWNAIQPNNHPPESLYLIGIDGTSLGVTLTVVMLFVLNQQMRRLALHHLFRGHRPVQQVVTVRTFTLQTSRR